MTRRYTVFCSYFIGDKNARRNIAKGLSWDDATELSLDMQARERILRTRKHGHYSSWRAKIYCRQLEH